MATSPGPPLDLALLVWYDGWDGLPQRGLLHSCGPTCAFRATQPSTRLRGPSGRRLDSGGALSQRGVLIPTNALKVRVLSR